MFFTYQARFVFGEYYKIHLFIEVHMINKLSCINSLFTTLVSTVSWFGFPGADIQFIDGFLYTS